MLDKLMHRYETPTPTPAPEPPMSLSLSRHTFAALLFLAACSSSATTDVNSTGTLQIQGAAMSGWGQNIRVTKNGAAATGLR